jgi:hypothetical protein
MRDINLDTGTRCRDAMHRVSTNNDNDHGISYTMRNINLNTGTCCRDAMHRVSTQRTRYISI